MNRLAANPTVFETIHIALLDGDKTRQHTRGFFPTKKDDQTTTRYSIEEIDGIYSAVDRPYSALYTVEETSYGIRVARWKNEVVQVYPWHRVFEIWRGKEALAVPGYRFEIVDGDVVEQEGAF